MSGSEARSNSWLTGVSKEWLNIGALVGAASISGLPADVFAFPFSRLKTLQMTKAADPSSPQFKGMWDAGKYVFRAQGVAGFYRGMSPVVVTAVPGTTLFFSGAYGAKALLGDSFLGNALSGFAGQLAGSLVWVPSEVLKELRQMAIMKPELKAMGTGQLFVHVCKKDGVRGLYRGLMAQLLTFGPFNSLGMAMAVEIKKKLPADWTDLEKDLMANFLAFSGAAVATTPMDVVKTRLQVASANPEIFPDKGILGCFKQVYKEAGVRGFFNGATERACWLGSRQALAFSTFGMAYVAVKKQLETGAELS
jgi:hypothetical protein